jgi:thiamine-phosphate pyrophosphorylase
MINKLQYISQADPSGSHIPAIEQALSAGCRWIQLRIKDQSRAYTHEQALQAKALCDTFGAKLIINDDPEIAVAVGARGVHLGLLDMAIPDARKIVGSDMIIGGTANTLEHVLQRVNEGADYVGLGPLRFTSTKKNLSPLLGFEGYQSILNQLSAEAIDIPVVAIGGIAVADVSRLMRLGLYGIAVSGLITHAADPQEVVHTLNIELNSRTNHLKPESC